MTKRTIHLDGNWDSGWLAGHESAMGWVLGMLRDYRATLPDQGRGLVDVIGVSVQAHRKRLERQEDWGDALCDTVEIAAQWLTEAQRERIRSAIDGV